MSKAGRTLGWSAAGALLLASGAWAAPGAPARSGLPSGEISLESVAREIQGEWNGQIEVRAADGSLSISLANMSARPSGSGDAVELYYEGCAFGKPVEGAMVLSYGANEHGAFRDECVQISGTCRPENSDDDTLSLSGQNDGRGRAIRAEFERHSHNSFSIQYQAKDASGQWAPIMTLHLDRMAKGQRSAAADSFDSARVVKGLRRSVASASVDTD